MNIIKKIYTILALLFNFIIRRENYKLTFICEDDNGVRRWYYKFKGWGFDHSNLEMVCGADKLCELYGNGENEVTIKIIARKYPYGMYFRHEFDHYEKLIPQSLGKKSMLDKYLFGADYKQEVDDVDIANGTQQKRFWICPVTLFVLGRYPNHIYISKL